MNNNLGGGAKLIIDVTGLGFRYTDTHPWILRDISLSIYAGEFLCLLGSNGSGKTTLAKLLIGELAPQMGHINYPGDEQKIAIRYQNYEKNTLPWYSAQRNLDLLSNRPWSDLEEEFSEFLAVAEYGLWREQRVSSLSGGQKQLLSFLATVILSPSFLVLDEPFSAVDPTKVIPLWELTRRWAKGAGVTVIAITHNIDEAVALGDRIILLTNPDCGGLEHFQINDRSGTLKDFLQSGEAHYARQRITDAFYGIR